MLVHLPRWAAHPLPPSYRMFAGELNGELVLCHLDARARDVRLSIGKLFNDDYASRHNSEVHWSRARKAGWRVVPVIVQRSV